MFSQVIYQLRLPGDCKFFTFKCSVNLTIKKKKKAWLAICQKKRCMSKVSFRNNGPDIFPQKGNLEKRSKTTDKHPCGSSIRTELLCNSIKITLPHGRSPRSPPHSPGISHYKNIIVELLLFFLSETDYLNNSINPKFRA